MIRLESARGARRETLQMGETGRFLVPLRSSFLRYFRDSLFVAHNARERLRLLASTLLPMVALKRLLFARRWRLTVLRGRTPQLPDTMPRHLRRALELASRNFVDAGGAFPETGEIDRGNWILCAGDADGDHDRAVAFLFTNDAAQPQAILKLRSGAAPADSLRREHAALQQLAKRLPARMQAQIPVPLAFDVYDGTEALLLSTLPGRAAYVEMQTTYRPQRCATRHLQAATQWLAGFHNGTRSSRSCALDTENAGRAAGREAIGPSTPRWLKDLRDVPLAAGHGDYWARNLLLDATGQVSGVVDWEHYQAVAPVYRDLFDFVLTYGLNFARSWSAYRRSEAGQAFRHTFVEDTALSRAVRACLYTYCEHAGLEVTQLRPLLLLYLLERMRGRGDEHTFMSNRTEPRFWIQCYETIHHGHSFALSG